MYLDDDGVSLRRELRNKLLMANCANRLLRQRADRLEATLFTAKRFIQDCGFESAQPFLDSLDKISCVLLVTVLKCNNVESDKFSKNCN